MAARSRLEAVSDLWASRWALHALPYFDTAKHAERLRRNAAWNWGFLLIQALALASYFLSWPSKEVLELRLAAASAFALAAYGWIDLNLCILRKTFMLHVRSAQVNRTADNIGSAWLMLMSLTLVYANLYLVAGRIGATFTQSLTDPTAALALSASTITTVGYGYYAPVGFWPVALTFLQAISGLALVSCVIAAAVSNALQERPPATSVTQAAVDTLRTSRSRSFIPWLVFLILFGGAILFALCTFGKAAP